MPCGAVHGTAAPAAPGLAAVRPQRRLVRPVVVDVAPVVRMQFQRLLRLVLMEELVAPIPHQDLLLIMVVVAAAVVVMTVAAQRLAVLAALAVVVPEVILLTRWFQLPEQQILVEAEAEAALTVRPASPGPLGAPASLLSAITRWSR